MKIFLKIIFAVVVIVALYAMFNKTAGHASISWAPWLGILFTNAIAGLIFNIILWGCVLMVIYSLLKKIFKRA